MSDTKIFLSSTFKDLEEHREQVFRAVQKLEGYACVRMEDFGARDWEADEFCRRRVDECDIFVGILGHLYGSCPAGGLQSYTEREYEMAIARNKPRLMFLAVEDMPLPANLVRDQHITKENWERSSCQGFREPRCRRAASGRLFFYNSGRPCHTQVVQAVHNLMREQNTAPRKRPTKPSFRNIPLPPQPYLVHPYPLQKNFTGRLGERRMLSDWLRANDEPVISLVAIGGMGKSALAWVWMYRDVLGLPVPGFAEAATANDGVRLQGSDRPEGVFWWSFYEPRGSL